MPHPTCSVQHLADVGQLRAVTDGMDRVTGRAYCSVLVELDRAARP
ncbi:hypothetical protein [Streptomyces violaceorubidus]|nr:hypothetical protein [Streptomyces violaceorubidus]